ncbi:MAG: RNA methyltransferase [Acidobacteriota bacterium]
MIPVSHFDDPRLAEYAALGAPAVLRGRGLFVAEGRLVVRRLLALPRFTIRSVLVTTAAWREMTATLQPAAARIPVYVVPQEVMNGVTGFNIHRGCLAIAERPPDVPLEALPLRTARRLLVLEHVSNPDNIGGLFRSAAAFDVDAVVLGPACGDPLYRKAVRTSMGATLVVPFASAGNWPGGLETIGASGIEVLALTPDGDTRLVDVPCDLPRLALVAGAEGSGLSAEALARCRRRVSITMTGRVDSLNVATAASIALHHFFAR